jgi:hypothetical protein
MIPAARAVSSCRAEMPRMSITSVIAAIAWNKLATRPIVAADEGTPRARSEPHEMTPEMR